MSLLTSSARVLAKHGKQHQHLLSQLRSFSSVPSSWYNGESLDSSTPTDPTVEQQLHQETHYSFSLEEALEKLFEMQRLGHDHNDNGTWESVVRSQILPAANDEEEDILLPAGNNHNNKNGVEDLHCQGPCHVCGRSHDVCDICATGMIVSRFVPDSSSR